jgi:hypothetical protein
MRFKRPCAVLLALMTACAGSPRVSQAGSYLDEAQALAAVRYELSFLNVGAEGVEPVTVSAEDFRKLVHVVARDVRPSARPLESAQWLFGQKLQADLMAEVDRDQVVRMTPLEETSPLLAPTAAERTRDYLRMCQEEYGGGDCIGLLGDGPVLDRGDLRVLALALSLGSVLKETQHSLKEMVDPKAVLGMVLSAAAVYLAMWLIPEPLSKGLAAGLTVALIAWLGVETVWSLMDGWAQLVYEADRATTFAKLRTAGEKYSRVLGENTARALVMLVTAALGGTAAKFAGKLPKLPGFSRAAAQAEAQGSARLAEVAQVESVAVSSEGTFAALMRSPGSAGATVPGGARSAAIIIRHRGGNLQVFIDGQRWHVPANRSVSEIPATDSLGDQLQAAAKQAAQRWSWDELLPAEQRAIELARAQGQYLKARLMERMFRGKYVERALREQFRQLRWNSKGVDAVDPATGYSYEILSGTKSNMELHGRRMAEEFFRMIAF